MSQKIKILVKNLLRKNNIIDFPIDINKIVKHENIELRFATLENSVSGFLYKKHGQIVISVNEDHNIARQRFTIAHELGHYILDHFGELFLDKGHLYRDNNSSTGTLKWEREANRFAAELLMPEEMIVEQFYKKDYNDFFDLETLADELEVSTQALNYRLINLNLISLY